MKIIMGMCGIGNGHTFRQLPIFKHLLEQGHTVMVFGYGASYDYFKKHYGHHERVHVVEVANPYFMGDASGLNFYASQHHPVNKKNFHEVNCSAMQQANELIGSPDLVISDYECVSAQYAYAKNAKLVTLDQQSKFLVGSFIKPLNGTAYTDEIERLRMFFPRAERRLAISFFRVNARLDATEAVEIYPPIIRDEILALKDRPKSAKRSILVYFSAQTSMKQSYIDILVKLSAFPDIDFHAFFPRDVDLIDYNEHVHCYHHGDARYEPILAGAHGVITTAGHTLLSELLYLEKPVFALPLALYEQQINAKIIDDNGFGIARNATDPTPVTEQNLKTFLDNLERYASNIKQDDRILLKGSGLEPIIQAIDATLGVNRTLSLSK